MEIKGSFARYTFERGFILAEEHLRTIASILRERYPNELVTYTITKNNSFEYKTSDLEDVLKEENGKANGIIAIKIEIENEDNVYVALYFEKGTETILAIRSNDRDTSYLLYNELKTYIEKESTIIRSFISSQSFYNIIQYLILIPIFVGFSYFINRDYFSNIESIKAIQTNDIIYKLNYLIEERQGYANETKTIYIILLVIIAIFLVPHILILFFGKKGIFIISDYILIGKEISEYEKKIKLRSNIIWTIIIGMLVSIMGSLLVFFITQR